MATITVSRIVNLKFFDIHDRSFSHAAYKFFPSIKNILNVSFFFLLVHFLWACRNLQEPWDFSNSLVVHSLVCPITHSFLDDFQPNLHRHFSHVCCLGNI